MNILTLVFRGLDFPFRYYMQIIFSTEVVTSTDPVNIIMSMFRLDAPYNDDGHHNGAQNEIQQVQLRADKDDDIQVNIIAIVTYLVNIDKIIYPV